MDAGLSVPLDLLGPHRQIEPADWRYPGVDETLAESHIEIRLGGHGLADRWTAELARIAFVGFLFFWAVRLASLGMPAQDEAGEAGCSWPEVGAAEPLLGTPGERHCDGGALQA